MRLEKTMMLSQPMKGLTEEEILDKRNEMFIKIKEFGYKPLNTLFCFDSEELGSENVKQEPVFYLAKSIEKMSKCNAVMFVYGWEKARGCRIEKAIAEAYGLEVYEELEDGSIQIPLTDATTD